jgi:hypothetical protein
MTVLEKRTASGVEVRGITKYLAVGVVSVAIGVGVGLSLGVDQAAGEGLNSVAQQAMVERGAAVGAHLDSLWATGLAQLAVRDEAVLHARIERAEPGNRAIQMRGRAMADHLDALIANGLVQQELQSR